VRRSVSENGNRSSRRKRKHGHATYTKQNQSKRENKAPAPFPFSVLQTLQVSFAAKIFHADGKAQDPHPFLCFNAFVIPLAFGFLSFVIGCGSAAPCSLCPPWVRLPAKQHNGASPPKNQKQKNIPDNPDKKPTPSPQATYNMATTLPKLATTLPKLATTLPKLAKAGQSWPKRATTWPERDTAWTTPARTNRGQKRTTPDNSLAVRFAPCACALCVLDAIPKKILGHFHISTPNPPPFPSFPFLPAKKTNLAPSGKKLGQTPFSPRTRPLTPGKQEGNKWESAGNRVGIPGNFPGIPHHLPTGHRHNLSSQFFEITRKKNPQRSIARATDEKWGVQRFRLHP
jgi:hypothetical protein